MPIVFSLPNSMPSWNVHKRKNIEALLEFVFAYLIDYYPLLLYVFEKKDVREDMRVFVASYDFALWKDWWVSMSCQCVFSGDVFNNTSKTFSKIVSLFSSSSLYFTCIYIFLVKHFTLVYVLQNCLFHIILSIHPNSRSKFVFQ